MRGLALGVTPHVIRTRDRALHAWCAWDVEGDRVLSSFCHHILFFESERAWRAWEEERRQGTFSLSVEEAFRLGREVDRIRYGDELDTEGR